MKHLDLFSGIGGFALAARWAGIETVGFCEIKEYPRKVLQKNFPGVPIHNDIKQLDGSEYESVDLITGGYPCQPFSLAGRNRQGTKDDRHLWPEMLRIITQARPTWVVCENVVGHITMGLDAVLSDLESEGYAARTFVIPACAVDAQHKRERTWIVAYSGGDGDGRGDRACQREWKPEETLPDGWRNRRQEDGKWEAEPGVGRVADGVPGAVDRIRGLGNAIVPQVAYEILRCLKAH